MKLTDAVKKIEDFAGSNAGIALFLAWCIITPFVMIDAANYGISIWTAALVVLTLRAAQADRAALHAKLDALVHDADQIDDKLVRAEELDVERIEQLRS